MINYEDATCDARDLADLLDCTPRNILHMVDYGMPLFERGKAGKGHIFKVPWSMSWWGGWHACKRLGKPVPGTLETFLIGSSLAWGGPGMSFKEWLKNTQETAKSMGYSDHAFDSALLYVISKKLLQF